MSAKVSLIAAVDRRMAIGWRGELLFHLPADLKHFKEQTLGHTVIMGRRTYESLPHGALPNRRNIVLSRQRNVHFPGAETFASLEEALQNCADEEQVFVMGGATVYAEAMSLADELLLTEIDATAPEADVYFPVFSPTKWIEIKREEHPADDRHPVPFAFVNYQNSSNSIGT
jgi:dihydrofolate reductase